MNPLISIITVSFNAAKTISETIDSIVDQEFRNYEYIIIDGGSTDGTCEIVEKYRDALAYYVSEKDNGIYDAMNKGILNAKGDYIYFIGSDDVLTDKYVLQKISPFLKDKGRIYYGDVIFKTRNVVYDGAFSKFKIVTRNISHQSIFYPNTVFSNNRFEIKYRIFADYALNLKLYCDANYIFKYIPVIVAIFNDEGASGSNVLDQNFKDDFHLIIKNYFPFYIYFYRLIRTRLSKMFNNE